MLNDSKSKMHAVQSALAIRRERERRQSLKGKNKRKSSATSTGIPADFRPTEERSGGANGTCNYTTVGISFIIFGSLMMVPVFAGSSETLDLDWHHLLGIGGLLICVGIIMVVVHNCVDDRPEMVEQALDKYRVKRSSSHNPIIEDVEYGIDSRRSSVQSTNNPSSNTTIPKKFDQEPGGVVKVWNFWIFTTIILSYPRVLPYFQIQTKPYKHRSYNKISMLAAQITMSKN